jgi:hypothetical protein
VEADMQFDILEKLGKRCMVIQIMFSLAGYCSFDAYLAKSGRRYILEEMFRDGRPCDFVGRMPSDIRKCNTIAVRLSQNGVWHKEVGGCKINQDNLNILLPVQSSVMEILGITKVKHAIELVSGTLEETGRIEGKKLEELYGHMFQELKDVEIFGEIQKHL